ncbi:tape measure protein [Pseudomonas sp. GV071]|uniref:tape measure protein n=1 Tax=Pseudomonas sp. GV071 TaxID=2135754 RepID=UPI000D378563|nr:tape measure protein [Pseudomonas sp. GV071]PTQ70351.1 tape measure domain-containing protein [Pseudomonas sp. GV071]
MTDIELRLTADASGAQKQIAGFRKEYAELVKAIVKPLGQIDSLKQTQENAKKAAAEFYSAQRAVDQLKKAAASADTPIKGLNQQLGSAERALSRATVEFERQKDAVRSQRSELRNAGVDVHNLATEQQRLQAELAKGVSSGRNDQAVVGIRAQAAALAQVTREQRLANIEESRSALGVNRYRELNAELTRLQAQYGLVRRAGGLTAKELAIAQREVTRRIGETQQALRELTGEQNRVGPGSSIAGLLGQVGGAYAGIEVIRSIANITDSAKSMQAQLKLATKSQEEFNQAQTDTYKIAQENRAPLEDVVRLYARLSPALTDIGYSQRDVTGVTDALAKALKISGATTEETASTLTQFSQALGSGVLRGEEFNSVAEAAPRLLRAFAEGLGVPVGALRDMAAEGKLTADVIADLTLNALPQLTAEAAQLPDTVGGALTRLKNSVLLFASAADESTGFTQGLITRLNILSKAAEVANGSMKALSKDGLQGLEKYAEGLNGEAKIAFLEGIVNDLKEAKKELDEDGKLGIANRFIYGDMTAADFEQQIAAFEGQVEQLKAIGRVEVTAAEINANAVAAAKRKQVSALKALSAEQLKDAEKALKAQAAAEKKALADSQKVKDARVAIEAKYAETIATLNNGAGGSTASYSNAQSLKLSAQESLRQGDIASAKKQAEAARQMLLDIQSAGGNTYGLSGFAKGLQEIELAANDLEQSEADQKLLTIATNIAVLKSKADELKDIKVTPTMDEAAVSELETRIQSLANDLGKTLVIPAVIVPTLAPQTDLNAIALQPDTQLNYPGFAEGGHISGPGSGTSDSILARLSNGEFVVTASAARHYGPEVLEQLNARRLPKFATGGFAGQRQGPQLPAFSPPATALPAPEFPHLGRLDIGVGGNTYSVFADHDNFSKLAMKFGRPARR